MNKRYYEKDIINFMSDTAQLVKNTQADTIGNILIATKNADNLTNNVEFWKWFTKSYPKFADNSVLQRAATNNTNNITKIIQGKGYEWDFMTNQRSLPKNITNKIIADTNATQPGFDVESINLISGQKTLFQNKAYTSNNTPHLINTTNDIIVVTNHEQIAPVQKLGYNTISFQDKNTIRQNTNIRINQAAKGNAISSYNLKNVGTTLAQSGLIGIAIGVTMETIASYISWKKGEISDSDYLKEIARAGCESGLTGAITAGIMIPVTAFLTAAGLSGAPITIPVAFMFGMAINKIIAPIFKRGEYREILNEAKYYKYLMDIHNDLISTLEISAKELENFANTYVIQERIFNKINNETQQLNLKNKLIESNKKEAVLTLKCIDDMIKKF